MKKILLIIEREYLTRVKKKSFIIMTLLGPVIFAAAMIVPVLLTLSDDDQETITVVDQSGFVAAGLENEESLTFTASDKSLQEELKELYTNENTAILYIPQDVETNPNKIEVFYEKRPSTATVKYIERHIADLIETKRLSERYSLNPSDLKNLRPKVDISTNKVSEQGEAEKSSDGLGMVIGFIAAFLIYIFIFLYGTQIMRGVIEEKTNRIIEVIISSVKPFELMLGKVIGVAGVGLTQFLLWIILTWGVSTVAGSFMAEKFGEKANFKTEMAKNISKDSNAAEQINEIPSSFYSETMEKLGALNIPLLLICFVFYFLGGYLLYGAMFAAVGSAVDNETDSQQFLFPITIPLIIAIVTAQTAINNPDGTMAFWMSIIPFTSPIVMMVRLPFGVPTSDLIISIVALIAAFIGMVWIAGRIYRVGILMYGKKPTFKEIGKWIFYKG